MCRKAFTSILDGKFHSCDEEDETLRTLEFKLVQGRCVKIWSTGCSVATDVHGARDVVILVLNLKHVRVWCRRELRVRGKRPRGAALVGTLARVGLALPAPGK